MPRLPVTFARQKPAAGASRVTTHYLGQWIAAQSEPRIVGPLAASTYAQMSPSERHAACAFDNVCSCVRLSVWAVHQFPATPIAEDLEWARDVLLAGHRLAYVPEAVVEHSHDRSVTYELQRTYLVHQRLQAIFGLSTVPTTRIVNARRGLDGSGQCKSCRRVSRADGFAPSFAARPSVSPSRSDNILAHARRENIENSFEPTESDAHSPGGPRISTGRQRGH